MSSSNGMPSWKGVCMTEAGQETSRQRHIALYIGSLEKGGAQRVLVNLASYLLQKKWRVTFVTTFRMEDEFPLPEGADRVISGLTETETGALRTANILRRRKKLRGIWQQLRPDLILSFIGKNNIMAVQTAEGLGIPVLVSVRSDPAREYGDRMLRAAMHMTFPKAAGVIVQTEGAKAFFTEPIRRKCRVLPNMLQDAFVTTPVVQERQNRVVVVGRLDDNKNQRMAVKAFAQTAAEFPDWTMTLYGEGPDKKRIARLIRELQQEQRIFLAGNVEDVAGAIADARIFVLPSRKEGMPNALLEAMAMGLAPVATDCPAYAVREIIEDGVNGLLVPVDDAEAMMKAMRELMRDREKTSRMGEAALRVREQYAPERVCAQWEAFFEEVTDAV